MHKDSILYKPPVTGEQAYPANLFKGIALFTPAGDLIYCLDPGKRGRWHLHLCMGLQEILGLPEPPHFLVPGYTATIDRWLDPQTQQLRQSAEIYPLVQRHRDLLAAVFGVEKEAWQLVRWQEQFCDPTVIETYCDRFPQLWQEQELVVRLPYPEEQGIDSEQSLQRPIHKPSLTNPSYILRLFVSGHNQATEQTLKTLHQLLEKELAEPYTLKVVDISKHPEQAEMNQISATPTLMRVLPEPVRRIVGEWEDLQRVLQIIASA